MSYNVHDEKVKGALSLRVDKMADETPAGSTAAGLAKRETKVWF